MTWLNVTTEADPDSEMVLTRRAVPVAAWAAKLADSDVGKYMRRYSCDPMTALIAIRDDREADDVEGRIAAAERFADSYPAETERITFTEWCGREVQRLKQRGIRAKIINRGAHICVVREG